MNSNNGDLHFRASIDLDQFNASAKAMEERTRQIVNNVSHGSDQMDASIQRFAENGAKAITGILVGSGFASLLKSIVETRGEFQQLEIAFETMLGSATESATLMNQLTNTAAKTPFDLKGIAQGAKQLLAYGTAAEDVNSTLVHLGDIAAGLSIPLNDLVYLYGTTMTQGRMFTMDLRQFMGRGIPIAEELAKQFGVAKDKVADLVSQGKVGAEEFNKAIMAMSSEGGKFYNLMEKQSASLTGQISNLEDAWDVAKNQIGQSLEGVASTGIQAASALVENLIPIIDAVKKIAIVYGTWKAATIALNVIRKDETGIALIDNTIKQAKIKLLQMEEKAQGGVKDKIEELKAARKEEIASLESQLTYEQRLALLHESKINSIDALLTEQQKLELSNLGLTKSSEDYEAVAMSMMSTEQRMSLDKMDLTKNTSAYVDALQDAVSASNEEKKTLDDRYKVVREQLQQADELIESKEAEIDSIKEFIANKKEELEAIGDNADGISELVDAEELDNAQKKLLQVQEELNTAVEQRNTAQTELNTISKRQNAIATGQSTTADTANATAKTLLSRATIILTGAVRKLGLAIKANPIGAVLTALSALAMILPAIIGKIKEKRQAVDDDNKALAEFNKQVREQNDKLDTIKVGLSYATKGSQQYQKSLDDLNEMCKQYNLTMLDENATIDEQTAKYKELEVAVQNATAAKLRDKFTDDAYTGRHDRESKILGQMKKSLTGRRIDKKIVDAMNDGAKSETFFALMQQKANEVASGTKSMKDAKKELEKAMSKLAYGNDNTSIGAASKYIGDTFGYLYISAKNFGKEISDINDTLGVLESNSTAPAENFKSASEHAKDLNEQIKQYEQAISDIRSGKVNVSDPSSEIEKYEKNIKAAQDAIERLTGKKTKTKSSSQEVADKEFERQQKMFAIKEAEIKATLNGIEQQMALEDLRHQKALSAIDKQAKDYKKKMGEAYSQSDVDYLKKSEEKDHVANKLKLFNEQINYMREQYEKYYQWEYSVGKDAANKQFSGLMEQGKSFSEWVDKRLAELEAKKLAGNADASDLEQINTLRTISDSNHGKKSYVDELTAQINDAAGSATTLIRKIAILNAYIQQIKSSSLLNPQEKEQMILSVTEMLVNAESENAKRYAETYKDYAQTRREIAEQYSADIKNLKSEGKLFQAQQLEQSMRKELGSMDENFIKSIFSNLFNGQATSKAIKSAIKDMSKMKTLTKDEFNKLYNQNLSADEWEQLKQKIDAVGMSLKNMSGYNIADAFKDIRDGRIEGDMEKIKRGTDHLQSTFSTFTSVVNTLSSALRELADASDNDNFKNTADTIEGMSKVLNTAGSFAGIGASVGGGWGALAGGVLGLGVGIATEVLNSNASAQLALKKSLELGFEAINNGINDMISAVDSVSDAVTSLNYEGYSKGLYDLINKINSSEGSLYTTTFKDSHGKDTNLWNYINNLVSQGLFDKKNILGGILSDSDLNEIRRRSIEETEREYTRDQQRLTFAGIGHRDYNDIFKEIYADNMADYINGYAEYLYNEQQAIGERLKELYYSGSKDSLGIFNATQDYKKNQLDQLRLEYALADSEEKRKEILEQIRELEFDITNSMEKMAESLYGSSISDIVNDWMEIFSEFGNNVDLAFSKIDKGLDNMIYNMITKRAIYEPMMSRIAEIFNEIDSDADGKFTQEELVQGVELLRNFKEEARDIYNAGMDAIREAGLTPDLFSGADTLTGSIQNVSEETAGIIAGRLNAVVINQAEATSVLRQSLIAQTEMKNHLSVIADEVRTIRSAVADQQARINPSINYGM